MDLIGSFVCFCNSDYENGRLSRIAASVSAFGRTRLSRKVCLGWFVFGSIMLMIGLQRCCVSTPIHRAELEIDQAVNLDLSVEAAPSTGETSITIRRSSDYFQEHLVF